MATFKLLTETEKNEHHKKVFEIIAAHESDHKETEDGYEEIVLDSSELSMIRDEMYDLVKENLTNDGATIQTATEMRESMRLKTQENIQAFVNEERARLKMQNNKGIVQDGYYNPTSGVGTYIDPGMNTQTAIPVSITPTEATAYYANGGIPARIINKKAGCLSLDGVKFQCEAFSPEDLQTLEDYAYKCGFVEQKAQTDTQALIFGGAVLYPVLEGDNPIRMQNGINELLAELPEKNFIKYWVTADRWNCVFVPQTNITAQDYLYARSLFIPLGGYRVNTRRMAMVRPNRLPFWGAIKQMGWSTSDFEGWIKDYESYEMMKMSLPIMAQQMSLMYHQFPADGMIIENGPEYAKQFFKQNEAEMRQWSMFHPKAINSVGEIKILERTYSGFQQLIAESRLALCSGASVPESILFAEKPSGLASDNKEDITLKQSEAIRLLFNNTAPSYKNCIELLVYSCFGKNSEQAKHAKEVTIKPDDGVILSDQDKAQMFSTFVQTTGQLVQMGLPLDKAMDLSHKNIPSVEVDEDMMNELEEFGENQGMDQEMWDNFNEGRGNAPGMNPDELQNGAEQPIEPLEAGPQE